VADGQPDRVSFPTLVMNGGPLDGTEYALPLTGKPIVLGSSMDADVQILLGNIEAAHAFITFAGGELVLSDAASATGTFVNGEKVEADRPLNDGDRICLGPPGAKGSAKLLLKLPAGASSPADTRAQATPQAAPAMGADRDMPALSDQGEAPSLDGAHGGAYSAEVGLELSAPETHEPLFSAPLPTAPPDAPTVAPAPPAFAGVHSTAVAGASARADSAPGPERPSPAPPSAPPRPPAAPVPVPPPPPPPPPAPPRAPSAAGAPGARPEYHSELPSYPVAKDQPDASGRGEFPALRPSGRRPSAKDAGSKGRATARRRGLLSLPSLPAPAAAALVAVAVLGFTAWTLLRATPPQLVSALPPRVEPGQTLTLKGKNFAKDPASNTVLFGALRGVISSATTTELKVIVPAEAKSAVPVLVETRGGRTSPLSVIITARGEASSVEPDVAMPGQTILLRGQAPAGKLAVLVAGIPALSVESVAEGVRAVVPEVGLPEGVKTFVTVQTGTTPARTFDLLIGRLPLVQGVKPETGPVGEIVAIRGRGFAADRHGNAVTFAGQPALVVSASSTELKAVVPPPPPGDIQPELAVVVTAGGRTSTSSASFQLTRGVTSGFRPRFFAATVSEYPGDDLAFVSTELGPVLLLAGRAGGASAAERSLAAAAALNKVVEAAPGRPAAFELRERPEPGVAVPGSPQLLVEATVEDAAAYARPWETGKGAGRHVSASALARHWTALLQDYLGLFLERQRPIQFVAQSPHARVLSDIYAEASRRSPGERTVPASVVLPTTPAMAASLRLMALVVSTETPRAAVAVEGRWQGRIDDPEHGGQAFQVQLGSDSGRLSGAITTAAGSIEVRTPLREIAFERGSLRFTADLQGAPCRFKGTLDRNNVSGTVERTGRKALPFAMQFVE
jgi:hypothetical protein